MRPNPPGESPASPAASSATGSCGSNPPRARLRFRLAADQIALLLPLAGRELIVAGHAIRLGVPQVRLLVPAAALIARVVVLARRPSHGRQAPCPASSWSMTTPQPAPLLP
jgi:hypothetical protein